MDTIIIVILLVMIVGILWWVLKPFWGSPSYAANAPSSPQQTLAELTQRRDAFYSIIKNLELDFETGKIPTVDYQHMRTNLVQQAADILRQIDHLAGGESVCPNCTRPTRSDDAFCSQCGTPLANRCPTCQGVAKHSDAFCTRCGTRLLVEVVD